MRKKAVIFREHTLGLMGSGNTIEPLHASVLRGATFTVHPSPFQADMQDVRMATKQDFEEFRVKWHPEYEVAA